MHELLLKRASSPVTSPPTTRVPVPSSYSLYTAGKAADDYHVERSQLLQQPPR